MNDQKLQELLDREAIKEVRGLLAQALDYKDWALFESLFLEEVEADFTAYGVPAQKVRREDLRGSYQHNLSREGLRTQHISSNFRITIDGDTARCISNFLAQHYIQGFEGGEEFFLRAEYTDQLTRTEGGWKISAIILSKLFYTSGNSGILAE
ncbi:MAG: nuclear transport factor 2 family protein [Ktedonobacteraceae bacterium]|nr:nuclear transport factor 2 family protein [Ktedonobacteraceae bacterium]